VPFKTAQLPCLTCADAVNDGELRHVFDMIKLLGGHLADATLSRPGERKRIGGASQPALSGHPQGSGPAGSHSAVSGSMGPEP
jgi:hypothetical protein